MTPKRAVQWTFATGFVAIVLLSIATATLDVFNGRFVRIEALLRVGDERLIVLLFAILSAVVATTVVFLFGGSSQTLSFKFLGFEFSGPAVPAVLWGVVFAIAMITTIYGASELGTSTLDREQAMRIAVNVCSGGNVAKPGQPIESLKDLKSLKETLSTVGNPYVYNAWLECIDTKMAQLGYTGVGPVR